MTTSFSKKTSALKVGDIVNVHGMLCVIETPLSNFGHSKPDVLSTDARVLNRDEVPASVVPYGYTRRPDGVDRWVIQGNDLATWTVVLGYRFPVTCKVSAARTPVVTITVAGIEVKTRSPRRYVVVHFRPWHFTVTDHAVDSMNGTYVRFASVEKRTDNRTTALKAAQKVGISWTGVRAIAVDTVTGEVVR